MGEHKNKPTQPTQEQIAREVAAKFAMKRAALIENFTCCMLRNVDADSTATSAQSLVDFAAKCADAVMEKCYKQPIEQEAE